MILLLAACGGVYVLVGDVQEAAVLLASVVVVVGITLHQRRRAEHALAALRDLSSPRALVVRDGREARIAGRDVVPGDVVVLAEGDRVPADGVVIWAINLRVDESLLTGESVPVDKLPPGAGAASPPLVHSGTLVVAGQGVARVTATGIRTTLGRIGKSLGDLDPGATRLETQVRALVRVVAAAGLAFCGIVALMYGLFRERWLDGILAGLALAMSVMPEEFPVILTLFLAVGAWRIARRHVLVRRMPALEALGATTVLCVDKTGTLTEGRIAVDTLSVGGRRWRVSSDERPPPEEFHRLLEFAVLASQEKPFDPMEQSINDLARRRLAGTEHLHETWTLVREYPLSRALLAMSHVWRAPAGGGWVVAAKGAPEATIDLCHLDARGAAEVATEVAGLAELGLRVLGVAAGRSESAELPTSQHDFVFELVGLIGFADPVRPGARDAVARCARAGIRTVMITGDHAGTARHVAERVGLPASAVVTGPELDAMDDAELARRAPVAGVFARVVPEQKLRLVRALRSRGEVVAMTGDGVNDAPALKAADIGIAMGVRGTDVAREAADIVLLDEDLSALADAIRLGRRVYDNVKKSTAYVLAIHVPIAGLALIPVVLGWPLVLLPVHIVFLELVIDPVSSIAFEAEPEEADVMARPPRDPREPLFASRLVGRALVQGMLALALVSVVLAIAVHTGYDAERSRAITFSTLVVTNLALILANRSTARGVRAALRGGNPVLWSVIAAALAALAASLFVPVPRAVLRFATPSAGDLAGALAVGAAGLLGFLLVKRPLGSAAAVAVVATLASAVGAGAEPSAGATLYRRYCAACHGERGRGDGPAADALCPRPSDLTRLDADVPELMRQIDGRRAIRAHGTAGMPVWGVVFEESLIGEPHARRTALLQMRTLAEYVHGLRRARAD